MIRGEVAFKGIRPYSIAIQAECFYTKKGLWKFAILTPTDGARTLLYDLAWKELYTIYVVTFRRKITKDEINLFHQCNYPIYDYLIIEKGMRYDAFAKQYGIDNIVHTTKELIFNGILFNGWYELKKELFKI